MPSGRPDAIVPGGDSSHRLIRHGEVDSTNEQALLAVAAGTARHGDVHLATEQRAGRGRLGRTWASPAGAGLYASLVLLPEPPPPLAETLTIAAGLAVVEAVQSLGVGGARLRWPNDVMVADDKLAGILVETRGLDPEAPHYVVGIGINVGQRDHPRAVMGGRTATNLSRLGAEADLDAVLGAVLQHLDRRMEQALDGDISLARDFLESARLLSVPVRVHHGRATTTGILRGMTWEDGLLLEGPLGEHLSVPLPFVRSVETLA